MIKQVIILGGHIQALGLARQAKSMGIPVILFIEDAYSIARYSTAVDKSVVFGSIDNMHKCLNPYQDTGALLFPTADQYVEFIADNQDDLSSHFVLGTPNKETVELFGNKRNTYIFASNLGIPYPKSWYPDDIDDLEEISKEAVFPLVVKPAVMYSFHKMFGKKAFRCDDKDALIDRCKAINDKIPLSSIIIQEFISGGAKDLYSYGVFAVDGDPKAWVMANRIRQNPMDFGNSTTFAVTCQIPEIEENARKILGETRYTGLAEVEFMYDEPTKSFKFLEVNTRAWKWHSISMGRGFGFLSELVKYHNQQSRDFKTEFDKTAWVERLTDFAVILKESIKGRMNIWEALGTYKQKKASAVWSWKDPLPGVMYVLLSPVLYIKRH